MVKFDAEKRAKEFWVAEYVSISVIMKWHGSRLKCIFNYVMSGQTLLLLGGECVEMFVNIHILILCLFQLSLFPKWR